MHIPRLRNEVSAPALSVYANVLQLNTLPSPNPEKYNDRAGMDSLWGFSRKYTRLRFERVSKVDACHKSDSSALSCHSI